MNDKKYLTALSAFGYFGPQRIKLLVEYFKSAKNVWKTSGKELSAIGLSAKKISEFEEFRNGFDIGQYFNRLKNLGVHVITLEDNDYPENLKDITDAPPVLYVRGKLKPQDDNAIAVVGSRLMTSYGRDATAKIASGLANFGITIVSGLALGVDAQAQRTAISSGGRTIAVLASGLDIISPASNMDLALKIIKKNGAVISEYPLGHIPFPSDFAVRNRLISGISKGVVVIEGRMKSGTFYTVHAAADQGRPVFAVPGPITSPSSEAPNYLLQNGAKLITSAKEVVEELNFQLKVDNEAIKKVMPETPEEEKLLSILEAEPAHLDELVRISGIKTGDISARLTIMEMKGMIKSLGGRNVQESLNSVFQ